MKGSLAIGSILNSTISDMGLYPNAQKYKVFSLWAGIVGEVARYARPRRLHGDTLYVATASSVWSQELHFMRESILAKVRQALGGDYIKEIRFSEHMWNKADGERRPFQEDNARLTPKSTEVLGTHAEGEIRDPDLSHAFARVALAMFRRQRHLLSKGYRLCKACGSFYPKEKGDCPACRIQREFVALGRAIAILDERPETPDAELAALLAFPDTRVCERARKEVESRLISFIAYRLAAEVRESEGGRGSGRRRSPQRALARSEAAQAVRRLASLRCGAAYESMRPEDVERAVGRRYASLARKG